MRKEAKGFKFIRAHAGFREYVLLKNGLRVLLSEMHDAPVVGLMVTYHVGSRNEVAGTTGATHMLEHLLFEDTKRYKKERVSALIEGKGALWNATTWFDRTNYFEVFPRDVFADALAVEAARMQDSLFNEQDRETEMTIVRNEFERGENDPMEALDKALWNTAFFSHPYRNPTIGYRCDIEAMRAADLRAFYHTFYHPNNATLTIIGDVAPLEALAAARKEFGRIPRSSHDIPAVRTTEVPQEGERRVVVSRKAGHPILGVGQKIPHALHPDIPALLVLADILAEGKGSRLGKALLSSGKASDIISMPMLLRDPSLACFYVHLTPGVSHEKAETVIARECKKLWTRGVTARELSAAKARTKTGEYSARTDIWPCFPK